MSHHSEALRDLGERLQQEGAANHLVQGLLQAGLESQDFAEWHILEQMIGQMGQISGDCEALEQYFTTGFLPIDLVSQAPALSVDSKSRNALVAGQSHLTGGDSRGGVADFPLLTPSPSLRRVWVQPVDVPSSVGQKAGPTVSPSTGSAPVAHPAADSMGSEAAARGGWSALAQAVAGGESGVMLSSLTNGLDTLPPPVPNPQPPAWDLDEIMDAISQEIDREYRYFYGD
jgi:hypothetical protein